MSGKENAMNDKSLFLFLTTTKETKKEGRINKEIIIMLVFIR